MTLAHIYETVAAWDRLEARRTRWSLESTLFGCSAAFGGKKAMKPYREFSKLLESISVWRSKRAEKKAKDPAKAFKMLCGFFGLKKAKKKEAS